MKSLLLISILINTLLLASCGGGGGGGSTPEEESTSSSGQVLFNQAVSDHQVFMARNGNGVAIWSAENDNGNDSIWSSSYDAVTDSWSTAAEIANYDRDILSFEAAANDNGEIHVVWTQFDASLTFGVFADGIFDDQIWGARYLPGTGWAESALIQDPLPASARTIILGTPTVAINNNGLAFLAWKQDNLDDLADPTRLYTLRFENTGIWETLRFIGQVNEDLFNTIGLSVNDTGHAILVWADSTATKKILFARHYTQTRGWDLLEFGPEFVEEDDISDVNNFYTIETQKLPNDDVLVFWSYLTKSTATRVSKGRQYTASDTSWALPYSFSPDLSAIASSSLGISKNGDAFFLYGDIVPSLGGRVLLANQFTFSSGWSVDRTMTEDDEVIALNLSAIDLDDSGNAMALWVSNHSAGNGNSLKSRRYHPINEWDSSVQEVDDFVDANTFTVDIIPDGNGNAMTLYIRSESSGESELTAKKVIVQN